MLKIKKDSAVAYIQKHFELYYEAIRTGYKYHTALKDKRNILIHNLENKLDFRFRYFNQGSYGMNIGVKPLNGDFDIDVGLIFEECYDNQFEDVIQLKKAVESALQFPDRTVKIKRPCVTVEYQKNGNVRYHVDFAIYKKQFLTGNLFFARGKPGDHIDDIAWEPADPEQLIDLIVNKYPMTQEKDRKQYRRCMRYLKKWKNNNISHKNLPSIALAIAVYKEFRPEYFDDKREQPNDVSALINFLVAFKLIICKKSILLPVKNYNSLLSNLTDVQAKEIDKKVDRLIIDLKKTQGADVRESTACSLMRKHFGSPFPEGKSEYSVKSSEQFIEHMFEIDLNLKEVDIDVEVYDRNQKMQSFWSTYTKISHDRKMLFTVNTQDLLPNDFRYYWKVRNIGKQAEKRDCLRGQIIEGTYQNSETADFGGDHYVECYIVVGQLCIARGRLEVPIED